MSLLNSNNPMFITGFQMMGAPMVRRYNLEAIPLGYVIVGEGSTAAYIGQAHAIPLKKPEVAALAPASATLADLPPVIIAKIPYLAPYKVALIDNQILLVDARECAIDRIELGR
jgi:geranylgeranylglyceryl phosphate synthase family protein